MAVILWPYNTGSKNLIIEDSVSNYRDVVFYNSTGSFEMIQGGNQLLLQSVKDLKDMVKKEDIHMLCPSFEACRKLETILKKNKIKTVVKNQSYVL